MGLLQSVGKLKGRTPALIALIVLLGIGERGLWNAMRPSPGAGGEAFYVAQALAQGRGLADAYRVGQGPTAHLLPISPSIAGGVYAVFGIKSSSAEFILACWSIGLAVGTYLVLFVAFAHLGSSLKSRLFGLGLGCLAPTYVSQESVDFRVWEGGLAVFLCALFLERLLALQKRQDFGMRAILGMCLLAAALCFVNPLLAFGVYACAALACWQRLSAARIIAVMAVAIAALAVFLVPWTLRNQAVLGAPVVLRSDAGLELAIGNYPGALEGNDPRERFLRRMEQIHPGYSDGAYSAMQAAGGEVAYSSQLAAATRRWIIANPGTTLQIAMLHLRETFLPETWQFHIFKSNLPQLRAVLASLISLLGLAAIVRSLIGRRRYWIYPALLIAVPSLCYLPFQPVPRYTYLLYPIMVFCAADWLTRKADRSADSPRASDP